MRQVPVLPSVVFVVGFFGCAPRAHVVSDQFERSYAAGPFVLSRQLQELKTILVGDYPKSVSLSPDQKRAYVCNLEGGSVDIIDVDSFELVKRIDFARNPIRLPDGSDDPHSFEEKPVEIAFTDQGRTVWISLLRAGGIVVHDTRGRMPVGKSAKQARVHDYKTGIEQPLKMKFIRTGRQPKVIAVSPNEKYVFVANWKGEDVAVIDAKRLRVIKKIRTGLLPRGICFSSQFAYVANFGANTISEIDLKTLKRTRNFRNVGKNPRHLVMAPDGKALYVSNHGDKQIRKIDLSSGKTIATCLVGEEPRSICMSRLNNYLFVTNYKDDTLSAIELSTMKPAMTLDTLQRPVGTSYDPKHDTLWVTGYWDKAVRVYKFECMVVRAISNDNSHEARGHLVK